MYRKLFSVVGIMIAVIVARAQEMWLQPEAFRVTPGKSVWINCMVGEGFPGDLWNGSVNSATSVRLLSIEGDKNITTDFIPGTERVSVNLTAGGTQLLCLSSNANTKKWEGTAFDSYLEDNGQEKAIAARKASVQSGKNTTERITWYAKLLIQVGDRTDDSFKKTSGMRVEIVPEANPYLLKPGDHLKCKVLFDGKPSPHTLVKVWSRLNHTSFLQNIYTEDDGSLVFPISMKGIWMISTVKIVSPAKDNVWEAYKGSLVFEN